MHDIKWIRENPEAFDAGLKKRGLKPMSKALLEDDKSYRAFLTDLQNMQAKRNEISMKIAELKKKKEDSSVLMHEVANIKRTMEDVEDQSRLLSEKLEEKLAFIPNLPLDDVPVGKDENDNKEVSKTFEPFPFQFTPKEHDALGVNLKLMDFDQAAKISGARFTVLKGALCNLSRAIAQFMLDTHTREHGYMEVEVPLLVNSDSMYGTAQLPKFEEDLFKTTDGRYLIPTAEVPLTNLVQERVVEEKDVPIRVTAHSACFRSEAGSAGKDTRGMIRQHQFYKVELVSLVKPEEGEAELERMTTCAENILKKLNLPFRRVLLCTGDMGFGAKKTYDLEVWLPGQNRYREISSCSYCGDFQTRRLGGRFKVNGQKGTTYLHSLNGSGLAVGRTLLAIMENYQQEDGSILVPEVLQPYMGGLDRITAAA